MRFPSILKERCVQALLIAVSVGWLVMAVRPPDYLAIFKASEDRFYYMKAHPPAEIDLLLVGDSRVMQGLSTEVFREHLPGCRSVFNYGFPSLRYTDETLDDIDKMLSGSGGEKRVILQLTKETFPLNPPQIVANRMIHEYREVSLLTGFLLRSRFDTVKCFLPLNLRQLWIGLKNPKAFQNYQNNTLQRMNNTIFHDDGWRQMLRPSGRPAVFAEMVHRRVSQSAVDSLMRRVQNWRSRGIHVYGFYPPSSERLQSYVDEMVQDANDDIEERFVRAGGKTIDVHDREYATYDDVHLASEQAERLTLEIVGRLTGSGDVPADSRRAGAERKRFVDPG